MPEKLRPAGGCGLLKASTLKVNRPFVPHVKLWEPRNFTEVPDGSQAYAVNILQLQEKVAQIRLSE